MLKKLSRKTSFVLIGIVVGIFVGVSVRQALGDTTSVPGTVRADNLTVNTSGQYTNGLIVANGNALVAGKVGIGTVNPSEALTVTGKVLSSGGFCIGTSCITQWNDLKTILGIGTTTPPVIPTSYTLAVIKDGTGTGTVVSAPTGINCGSACAYTFPINTSVTLTANKATGSVFTGWSNECITGTSPTVCTVVMSAVKNVRATFTSGTETPPPVCTGTHPAAGNGVVLNDYTAVVASPGGPSNTVWQYGAGSCGWGCTTPMERDGDVGCKNPVAGSGITITINNLSTGGKFSGISLSPATIFGLGSSFPAFGLGGTNGTFTTNASGVTPEFWLTNADAVGFRGAVGVNIPGYKIRSATGCGSDVSIHANQTNNLCIGLKNGTPVTINMVPGDISTLPTTHFDTLTYHRGETLKGTITGGDPNDTWGCMDNPNTVPGHECTSGWDVWRQLTVPYDGHADGWQLVETDQGDSIQLGGLLMEQGFPLGTYTMYVKTGQWGVPSQTTSKSITVVSGGGDSTVLAPTLSLSVANSSIASNASTTISWIPTNVTWCWAEPWNTPTGTGWKAFSSGTHTESTGNLTTTQTYTMKCGNGNAAQDVTKSVTVSVTGSNSSGHWGLIDTNNVGSALVIKENGVWKIQLGGGIFRNQQYSREVGSSCDVGSSDLNYNGYFESVPPVYYAAGGGETSSLSTAMQYGSNCPPSADTSGGCYYVKISRQTCLSNY